MQKQTISLGVNIDHVATLRQARGTRYPDVIYAALLAEQAGADGITAHLREDRRHIQDRDIELLKESVNTRLNLEMAVTDEMVAIARRVKPVACCLVPESREELTTEGGLDVVGHFEKVYAAVQGLVEVGIEVSLFVDAEPRQIEAAAKTGAPVVELHTGHYADAQDERLLASELSRIWEATRLGESLGLKVNAGHGLNYHNVEAICRVPAIRELNIGHSIVARAVFTGWERAVSDLKAIMRLARASV